MALEPQGGLVSLERDDTLEAAHKMQYDGYPYEVEGCIQQPPAGQICKTLMQKKYKEIADKGDINGAALSAGGSLDVM